MKLFDWWLDYWLEQTPYQWFYDLGVILMLFGCGLVCLFIFFTEKVKHNNIIASYRELVQQRCEIEQRLTKLFKMIANGETYFPICPCCKMKFYRDTPTQMHCGWCLETIKENNEI